MGNLGARIKLYLPIYLLRGRPPDKSERENATIGGLGRTAKISTVKATKKLDRSIV